MYGYNHGMTDFSNLSGVYAAAVTPLNHHGIILDNAIRLLDFLARRGCHGALLLGTTGEGPSFAPEERLALFQAALEIRQAHPTFRLLAGTGTPSLEESAELCHAAFDLGMDGVVVLPPYYFRKVTDDGLYAWFSELIERSVPQGSPLFGYHIPGVSGVPLSLDLIARLKDNYPDQFAGIKDSSSDPELAMQLGQRFGSSLVVLNGNDSLLTLALENGASGCITAMANITSPLSRAVWDAFQRGERATEEQARLNAARSFMDSYPPAPPLLKVLLAHRYQFPSWEVRPPLCDLSPQTTQVVLEKAAGIFGTAQHAAI